MLQHCFATPGDRRCLFVLSCASHSCLFVPLTPQALELQVRSLHDTVADLHRMVDEERRRRAWWPDLPHTVSTRGAVLGAMLLASSAAAAALMISRRQRTMAVA